MLDHISIRVSDYERSKQFYAAALSPLGYILLMESSSGAGFRKEFIPDFWIKQGEPGLSIHVASANDDRPPSGSVFSGCGGTAVHVAFASDDRATVDAFYRAALAAGGFDNGAPELRPEYHPNYYSAFVLDPDGYNIEAVCHKPEPGGNQE
jgi:catechol 2,3-dioxygenase-like lactoylglutathione lyase family enzyme